MTRTRRTRLITAIFALISLLFMQMAVAGYACPGAESKIAAISSMAEAGMPCAQSMTMNMDEEQPNLCKAHCQAGQQVSDKYELPAPGSIAALPPDFLLPVVISVLQGTPMQAPHLMRTTAPPVAIRHCCFRL